MFYAVLVIVLLVVLFIVPSVLLVVFYYWGPKGKAARRLAPDVGEKMKQDGA